MIKLSKCTEEGQVFLFREETVGLQYILRMIFNGGKLPTIRLITKDDYFNNAISDVLHQVYQDGQKGIYKESYELNEINSQIIMVDITKEDISQLDNDGYNFTM